MAALCAELRPAGSRFRACGEGGYFSARIRWHTLPGIALVLAPNPLLSLVGIAETTEVWVRVVGVLVVVIGVLDILIARADLRIVMRWGIYLRSGAAASLVAFAIADLVEPGILIFAAVDALSVVWAVLALRAEARTGTG